MKQVRDRANRKNLTLHQDELPALIEAIDLATRVTDQVRLLQVGDDPYEDAFLAVMNANDRQLGLPLSDHAGRNLLKRRVTVVVRHLLHRITGGE